MTLTSEMAPSGGRWRALQAALRHAGVLAFAGLAANAANVGVTVVIAHLLSTHGYGTLTELVAVFVVLSMPGSAVLVAVVRRIAAWEDGCGQGQVEVWLRRLRRGGTASVAVFVAAAWLTRGWLAHRLGVATPGGLVAAVAAGGGWALLSIERGVIQSRREYGTLARNLGVEAAARTILTVALVGAGLGAAGAGLALAGAMVLALAEARLANANSVAHPEANGLAPALAAVTPTACDDPLAPTPIADPVAMPPLTVGGQGWGAELATALGALGLIAVLQNVDVLVVGRQTHENAGPYGAISVACKAVVFAAIVLSGYLLPEAVARYRQGHHALPQLGIALAFVAAPGVLLLVLALAAPRLLLRVAFGPDKVGGSHAFAVLALAMILLGATVLFTHYLLGIGRRSVVIVLAVAAVAVTAALEAVHGKIVPTARVELAGQAALAGVLAIVVYRSTVHHARAV